MTTTFDIGIVGLGAVGSAALYHASARDVRVVGFDLLDPPHTIGSSHGGSRIIRRAYFEGAMYVPLLTRAYELWRDLEEKSGEALLHLNGCLTIGRSDGHLIVGAYESTKTFDIRCERLDPPDVHRRFPAFQIREDETALWEPEAGWLHPEACIRAHLKFAEQSGAEIRRNEPVRTWGASGAGLRIETGRGTYNIGRLILCAGGWIGPLLSEIHVPLHIERQVNAWFQPTADDDRFSPERCPVYVWEYAPDDVLYGFPDTGRGVKTGIHHSGDRVDHPDELDREVHDADVDALRRQSVRLLPQACGSVAESATCFYTNTPDEHYLIDWHPGLDRVVFASACSGHGFKASSAVGESLAKMAVGEEPVVDISPFRLKRFLTS
jgi:sarcosine oxidase